MLFIATTIMTQGAGLNFSQTAGSYTPITGGTVLVSGTFDDTNYPVTLTAAFTFNGIAYSQLVVNMNGKIALGNTLLSGTAYAALSSMTSPLKTDQL